LFKNLSVYFNLEKHISNVIIAEFFVQLVNTALFAIQLIYMQKEGYNDYQGATAVSYRFLGVLLFALPLGLIIKGRRLIGLFKLACYVSPFLSLLIIYAIDQKITWLLLTSQFFWGISFTCIQIPIMPYILRNCKVENQTEAIALSYSTFSFAGIFSGLLMAVLNNFNPIIFNEKFLLQIITFLSFFGIYFISKINFQESIPSLNSKRRDLSDFDWKLVTKALTPTLIIAVGAGLTIPFVSIFFYNVHGMDTDGFSILNSLGAMLVAISALLVPYIKKNIGYKIAVPSTQSFAVLALILLATTQFYSSLSIAVYIASGCFLLRQPLMNMAGPMTTEIVLKYVGKRNREVVSALTAAIWSGSWFISSRIFAFLREDGVEYVYVFLITSLLYGIGVIWYYFLIADYVKRENLGLIEQD
jgi:hypothetical protein